MLGKLPTTLNINGKAYKIRSDYRNILRIFEAFSDKELTDNEKLFICLKRLFVNFDSIPHKQYSEAYKAAYDFISCNMPDDDKSHTKTFNWIKDEQLIFPAVNKAAGVEVRAIPYLHWWTFFGYFQSIDAEGLFGTVLSIRQKKARGKKLEKYEQEFWRNNRSLMTLDEEKQEKAKPKTAEEKLLDMFDNLTDEAGE